MIEVLQPASLADALDVRARHPEAEPVCGATGVLVEINQRRRRPSALLDLTRIDELRAIDEDTAAGTIRLGAAVTYTDVIERLADAIPVLAAASRTIASPQIRNRATLGGAIALVDRTGDALTALLAAGTQVELARADAVRTVDLGELLDHGSVAEDELVTALHVRRARGPQAYAKAGERNAMVRATAAAAIALDPDVGEARIAIAGPGPRPARSPAAERLATEAPWAARTALSRVWLEHLGVATNVKGSDPFISHSAAVLVRRAFGRAWEAL